MEVEVGLVLGVGEVAVKHFLEERGLDGWGGEGRRD